MRVRHFRAILLGLAFMALTTAQVLAQAVNSAQIHGAITDPTGAAIQGANGKGDADQHRTGPQYGDQFRWCVLPSGAARRPL